MVASRFSIFYSSECLSLLFSFCSDQFQDWVENGFMGASILSHGGGTKYSDGCKL